MMKRKFTSLQINVIYGLLFLIMAWSYGIFETMDRGPYSRHQWRQADCLSITQHYYQDNLPFLEPEIHWRGKGDTGKTISEFPIIYYSVAKIWQVTGKHFWIYRGISFLIMSIGLFYLKKLAQRVLQDDFWAIFIPLLLFSSPILAYYSNSFMMDSNALALAMIAGYHYYRHRTERSYKHLVYACILFLFAGLLKITALLVFLGLGAIFLYELLWQERSLKTRWKELLPYGATLLFIFLWYRYAGAYNAKNMASVFLQGLLPIWEMTLADIQSHWKLLHSDLKPAFFNVPALCLIGLLFTGMILKFKQTNRFFLALCILSCMGIGGFLLLFFQVFNVHEYYLTNLLVIIPLVSLLVLEFLKRNHTEIFTSRTVKIVAALALIFMTYSAAVQTVVKYDIGKKWARNSFILDKEDVAYWDWFHWNYGNTLKDLETIEPLLEKLGIGKKDKVVSIPDGSINISLYLMNRNGYNDFGYREFTPTQRIEAAKKWGAKYLIINNVEIMKEEAYLQPYLKNKLGGTKHVGIYQL
jgi:hypothetical protein